MRLKGYVVVIINVVWVFGAFTYLLENYSGCSDGKETEQEVIERLTKEFGQQNAVKHYNLGVKHDTGEGLPQDFKEAMKWYRKSADQGNAEAQLNLGNTNGAGRGVPQDVNEA